MRGAFQARVLTQESAHSVRCEFGWPKSVQVSFSCTGGCNVDTYSHVSDYGIDPQQSYSRRVRLCERTVCEYE